ncbi:hypothetical protein D3C80_672220 [compost metagenome]
MPVIGKLLVQAEGIVLGGVVFIHPARAAAGGTRKVSRLAVAVEQRYTGGAVGIVGLVVHPQARGGGVRQVSFKHTVQQVAVLAVPVHEAVVGLLGGHQPTAQLSILDQRARDVSLGAVIVPRADPRLHIGLELASGAFAYHVDHAVGFTCTGHQASGPSHDLYTVEDGHVHQRAGHVAGQVLLNRVDPVELVGTDFGAARVDMKALAAVLRHGDARVLLQHICDARQVLVVHLLAGNDTDALRRLADRQVHLGCGTGHPRGVRAGPLGSRPKPDAVHVRCRQLHCTGFFTCGDDEIAIVTFPHHSQATARQQRLQACVDCVHTVQPRRFPALGGGGIKRQHDACLGREAGQCLAQVTLADVVLAGRAVGQSRGGGEQG